MSLGNKIDYTHSQYIYNNTQFDFSSISSRALLGAHNIRQQEASQVSISVESFYAHEGYDDVQIVNDIAVLRLSDPAPLNGKLLESFCIAVNNVLVLL